MKAITRIRIQGCPFFSGVLVTLILLLICFSVRSQNPLKVEIPDWALPGSPTHKQVPPPADFHRATLTDYTPIGIFEGQSEIGAALLPGASGYNKNTQQYTITASGYNIWYTRDEFRFLWEKMSGDFTIAADINFPNPNGFPDSKAVLIIRQSLDDDAKGAMVALHGSGKINMGWRPEKGKSTMQMKVAQKGALRLGFEKRGDSFSLWYCAKVEPMKKCGDPIQVHFCEPFYVGIGYCSHVPDKLDSAVFSEVVLKNRAGIW